jgi:phosphatidylserine/phosphatidylglycerophosphate/cardiolipin synthase-like enzyme
VGVIDDTWCCVGSGNLNRRSWTHDSELSCAVVGADRFAQRLRLQLACEHLARSGDDVADLLDAAGTFSAFAASARRLDEWHRAGRNGPRPSGQLRAYAAPQLGWKTRARATPLYRLIYDPDGRPLSKRLRGTF